MRALILADGASRGAVAGARALARAGWTVVAGGPAEPTLLTASRAVSARHVVARPQQGLDRFADDVAAAARASRADVVFPAGDDWVLALSAARGSVPAVVPYPEHERVVALLDKGGLASSAAVAGIATPRTVEASAAEIDDWDGPAIVKAASHWVPVDGAPTRFEVQRCDTRTGIKDRVAEIEAAGATAVLQTCVTGELRAVSAVVGEGGALVGVVQQRAIRLWPIPTGVSARAETTPIDETAVDIVTRLAESVCWRGLVELQLLVDEAGTWWLIDANARFYGSMQLAIAAGVNLPDLWGRQALGAPLPARRQTARPGVRYCWLEGDLRRAVAERRGGLVADLVGTLSYAAGATHSLISLRDPRPALLQGAALARRAGAKIRRSS